MLYSGCIYVLTPISNSADNICKILIKLPLSTMYLFFKIQIHEQYMGLILKVEVIYLAEKAM